MRLHCLLPVRDEADIIAQSLRHALTWADQILVYDTGSIDDTWEIVQSIAAEDSRIVPLKKACVFFSETHLRAYLFNVARQQMEDGDWFLRMDADEFHHVSPKEFVETKMDPHETIAYHQYYDFRLLQSESDAWAQGKETLADRKKAISERRRYYTINTGPEPRLCRYRKRMQWPIGISFPYNAGYIAKERLPIRHYPHRDPVQLQRRCRLRALMMSDPSHDKQSYLHWHEEDWKSLVTPDDYDGLHYWKEGEPLKTVRSLDHMRKLPLRLIQRVIHSALLPVLDIQRARFGPDDQPISLPPILVRRLEELLDRKNEIS